MRGQLTPRPSITPVAGQRVGSRLINGTQTQRLLLTISGTINVTAAGTAVRNRGSAWAMVEEVVLQENGRDVAVLDGRVLRYLTEHAAPGSLSASRLSGTGIASTTLRETAILHLAHPYAVSPRETAYLERDPRSNLEVQIKLHSDANIGDRILSGGTKAVTGLTVTVEQFHDPAERGLPLYAPFVTQYVETITAANSAFVSYIKTPHALRGIVLQEDSNIGEVTDIISTVALRADGRDFIGPTPAPKGSIQREAEALFGAAGSEAYTALWFQQGGRLANILQAGAQLNLRLELGVAPSVTAGVTSSLVRVTLLQLVRDDYVDPATGRRVVAPMVPAELV